jgi:hypothetical protein
VLPQALRAVIPAIVGQFIGLFKDTTLVEPSVGLIEFLGVANLISAQPDWLGVRREPYVFIALVYFIGQLSDGHLQPPAGAASGRGRALAARPPGNELGTHYEDRESQGAAGITGETDMSNETHTHSHDHGHTYTHDHGDEIIVCRDVHKWYGEFEALQSGVSMTVQAAAKSIVIIGPSGSGKSTFIRTINRLEEHQEGDIIVDGITLSHDIRNIAEIRREVGMVFQQFNLFPHLTVLENVMLAPIHVRKLDARACPGAGACHWLATASVSLSRPTSTPASSPAASSNAWPSPGRCAWSHSS